LRDCHFQAVQKRLARLAPIQVFFQFFAQRIIRSLPRFGIGIRGGLGAYLRPGCRLVQIFQNSAGHHGSSPSDLVGILPAHAAMGAFFTAISMIGFIAGAGIIVRNSIILVDFI
jgi:hypothetical protein